MNISYKKLFFSIVLFALSQFASATVINCENCTNPRATAINYVGSNPGRHTVHVVDVAQKKINSYRLRVIDMGGEPGFPTVMSSAFLFATPSHLAADFQTLLRSVDDLVLTASVAEFGPSGPGISSAWDLYANNGAQNLFLDAVYAHATMAMEVANILNMASESLGLTNFNVSITLTIPLPDGGEIAIVIKLVKLNPNGQFVGIYEIDFENSKDANGNPLVIRPNEGGPNDGGASFQANSESLADYLDAARRAGIPITGELGGNPANGQVSCEFVEPDVLVCILKKMVE